MGPPAELLDGVCFAYDETTKAPVGSKLACDGAPVNNPHDGTSATDQDSSIERKPGGLAGNCMDSFDNASDCGVSAPAARQRSTSPLTPPLPN